MNSEKRRADAPKVASRRAPIGVLTRRFLGPAILGLALAGCSVIPGTAWSRKQTLSPTRPSIHRRDLREKEKKEKKSLFGSWFQPEQPEPLKTTNDWMALEQIRP